MTEESQLFAKDLSLLGVPLYITAANIAIFELNCLSSNPEASTHLLCNPKPLK